MSIVVSAPRRWCSLGTTLISMVLAVAVHLRQTPIRHDLKAVQKVENSTEVATMSTGSKPPLKATGTLQGIVTCERAVPIPVLFHAGDQRVKDPAVCTADPILDESLLVNEESPHGIANVIIYLFRRPAGAEALQEQSHHVGMTAEGCVFRPRVVIVRVDQEIRVVSPDRTRHYLHTFPILSSPTKQVFGSIDDFGTVERQDATIRYEFPERTPIRVQCDNHPWMQAWHLPLDHDFAAVSDLRGRFSIGELPPGEHEFFIWHERLDRPLRRPVTISEGQTSELQIVLNLDQLRSRI